MPAGPDLWLVLDRAQRLAARTEGAFDVTVRPLVQVWRRARRQREMPSLEKLAAAREATGYRHLELDPRRRTARLLVPGMSLDLGGIAKGYAADEAMKVLRKHRINRALVAVAGDMVAGDPPPGKTGWRIEVPSLDAQSAPASQHVTLADAALSTSGDFFQRLELGGKRYSHIIDPRSGRPITDHSLVTVIAPDGITADSLATAISVLGPDAGLELIRRSPGVQARIHRQPAEKIEILQSDGFGRWLEP
jgi:thiamine biosynthesis lipoprotein